MSANDLRGLRGPGGLPRAGFCAGDGVGATEPDADDEESGVCCVVVECSDDGYHRGHLLASSESSGTSITSLRRQ